MNLISINIPEQDEINTTNKKTVNNQPNSEFKKWITDEFWKTVNQRYSTEVFLSLTHLFNNFNTSNSLISDEALKSSYYKNVKIYLDAITNEIVNSSNPNVSYDKVNAYFAAISLLNNEEEKVVFS